MRRFDSVLPLLCGVVSAVFLAGLAFIGPDPAQAGDQQPGISAPCTCPDSRKPDVQRLWPRPKLAGVQPLLDERDELAALEAVQVALSEVGDGSSYVWHRPGGIISGVIQPTASFKDTGGRVCRHIEVMLIAGSRTRKTEGIACRNLNGTWQLDG